MADPAFVMHKQLYIQASYSTAGGGFLSKKSIPLTEHTKLVMAIFQDENENKDIVVDYDSWDSPPQNTVVYSIHVWDASGGEYTKFNGWQHLDYNTYSTSYSRHVAAHLLLRDSLKEPSPRYTHYEIQVDVVIFEPMSQVGLSTIEFL